MNNIGEEVWKPVKGYEGLYEVSNYGRVKNLTTWNGKCHIPKPHIIHGSIQMMPWGYKRITVTLKRGDGKRGKDFKVHRLVAEAFLEKPKGCNVVNHKDFNPTNNRVDNLEWVTDKENHDYSTRAGRRGYLNNDQRKEIANKYLCGVKSWELQDEYGISPSVIRYTLIKQGIKPDAHRGKKYDIDLETLLEEFKSGIKNEELAKKYGCSGNLIARRKYQFRKAGKLF